MIDMAKARMVHRSISTSVQVSRLSLPAQLLFTWMIPHTDVEGKLKGDPIFLRGTIIPMLNWSTNRVKKCVEEIANQDLIYYWQEENEWIIEYINFDRYQTVRKDHEKTSYLPSFKAKKDSPSTDQRQSEVDVKSAQSNVSESNPTEVNKSEAKSIAMKSIKPIIDNLKEKQLPNSEGFTPKNKDEAAALYASETLEPENKNALFTTYLNAVRKGISSDIIYQFVSEIKLDSKIRNPGQVFNTKVKDYCKMKEDDES